MTLYGYAILGVAAIGLAMFAYAILRGWSERKTGEAVGAARQAAKDRAQGIVDAAARGPEALEAEGRKVFDELDAELGKKP